MSLLLCTTIVHAISMDVCTPVKGRRLPTDSVEVVAKPDSISKKIRAVFFGLTYGNNSSFLGRYQTEILPYYSADISYKSKTGFWLSLMGYDIRNDAVFLDEVDAMAGWSMDLSKRVDASIYYTRYFFNGSSGLIKSSVANTAAGSLGLDWGILYTKLTSYYIFGGANDFFLVLDNSRYIEFPHIFSRDDYISIEPKISVISGTQTFVDTHYVNRGTPLFEHPGNSSAAHGKPMQGGPSVTAVESARTTFNILSYEFSLPVAYNTGNFSFELNGRYSIPVNLLEGDPSVPQFFFTAGVVYYIGSK